MCRARSARVTATPSPDQAEKVAGASHLPHSKACLLDQLGRSSRRRSIRLLLDNWTKFGYGPRGWRPSFESGSRAPASSAASTPAPRGSPARTWSAVAASSAGERQGRRSRARRRARRRLRRGARARPGRSTSSMSARRTTSTGRWPRPRSPRASTWSVRSPWRSTPPRRRHSSAAAAESGLPGRRAVRLPLLPDRPRGARARGAGDSSERCTCCTAPTSRTGCSAPRTTTGASTRRPGGASRAFADIGSHWCDLAEFVTGHRLTRLSARTLTAVPERVSRLRRKAFAGGDGSGESRAVTTEDVALVQFETDGGALGSVVDQPGVGRPEEPAVDRARRLRVRARLRPGAAGAALGRPTRRRDDRPA